MQIVRILFDDTGFNFLTSGRIESNDQICVVFFTFIDENEQYIGNYDFDYLQQNCNGIAPTKCNFCSINLVSRQTFVKCIHVMDLIQIW